MDAAAPGGTALLIVDMLNDFNLPDSDRLRADATVAARIILTLRDAADAAKVPVIYVNDNYGLWHDDRAKLIDYVLHQGGDAAAVARTLRPRDHDFFVIKPKFSGFYATTLPVLLPTLKANCVIITGVAADICVLFTAADAHMRDYALWVPCDAVASLDPQRTQWALDIMKTAMSADVRSTTEQSLDAWLAEED